MRKLQKIIVRRPPRISNHKGINHKAIRRDFQSQRSSSYLWRLNKNIGRNQDFLKIDSPIIIKTAQLNNRK